jgi:hypothetical protein
MGHFHCVQAHLAQHGLGLLKCRPSHERLTSCRVYERLPGRQCPEHQILSRLHRDFFAKHLQNASKDASAV